MTLLTALQSHIAVAIIFLTGILLVLAAVFNVRFLFEQGRSGFFGKWSRLLYGLIGVLVLLMGAYILYSGRLIPAA